jgi:hypothetical protein
VKRNPASPLYKVTNLREVSPMHRKVAVGDLVVAEIVWRVNTARPHRVNGHGTNWHLELNPVCDLNGYPVDRQPIASTYGPVAIMWTADLTELPNQA